MTYLRIFATNQPTAVERRGEVRPMTPEDQAFWDWRAERKPKCEGFGKR